MLKRQSEIRILAALLFELFAFCVWYLSSVSDPADIPLFELHHGEDRRLHSVVEEGVPFGHIDDVELDGCSTRDVFDAKEKPLVVSSSIDIVLKNQVVLVVLALIHAIEVSALKIRIKIYLWSASKPQPLSPASLCQQRCFCIADYEPAFAHPPITLFTHRIHAERECGKVVAVVLTGKLLVKQSFSRIKLPQCHEVSVIVIIAFLFAQYPC